MTRDYKPSSRNRSKRSSGSGSSLLVGILIGLLLGLGIALAVRLGEYPQTVAAAARELAPHLVAFYLRDLCAAFHSYYNAVPFLVDDERTRLARLALVAAVRQALRNGLRLLGVSAPERM